MAELNQGQFFHLTDNPDFKLDPTKVPQDNAMAIRERNTPGLYTGNPETWINGHGYLRPYVAEIHAPAEALHDERWGGEKFLPAEHFDKAKVARVIPTDAYARETYGSHGWIEDRLGTEFDTNKKIETPPWNSPVSAHYPFKGYRYDGPDARQMGADDRKRHFDRWQERMDLPDG